MTAGVITVGGKKYAVALYWQVSDTSNAAKAARLAAQQPGTTSDFYCVRPGNNKGRAPQFGLGESKFGHKWNMPSAAASLANRQPGSWAGVFMVPEGSWFIEVRDDLIAPEGDMVFSDEAEAMSRLQEASARGGLEKIFAPPSWAIPGAEGSSLPALLSGKADARLKQMKVPKKLVGFLLLGLVGVVVLWSGVSYFLEMREQAEAEQLAEEQRRQAELGRMAEEDRQRALEQERLRQMQQQAQTLPSYQRVWEVMPKPMDWLSACEKTMAKVPVAPLGWNLVSLTCSGSQISASWSRTTGPATVPDGWNVDPTMRSASASYALPELAQRGREQLWPHEAILRYVLYNDWQAQLSYLPDETMPPLANGQVVPPPPWRSRSLVWRVDLAPWTLKGPLVDLPGLILNSLVWSSDGSWQIEGVLYEQRH